MVKPKPPDETEILERVYCSMDVHEGIDGLYYTEYAQWDQTCAVRVYPKTEQYDPETGAFAWLPETHGAPLLSLMTRMDVRDRLPELLQFLLKNM